MRLRIVGLLMSLATVPALASCGSGSADPTSASKGDCNGSIRFHRIVYVVDTRINQAAPGGRTLGPGAVVDCDHRTVVDRVIVSAVTGADRRLAIRVRRGDWHGVYVAENLPRNQWPAVLRH